jgi:hypothetical protein
MDLLEGAKELINQGSSQTSSRMAYLQTLAPQTSPQKAEVKSATAKDKQVQPKNPSTNTYLLVSGLILLIASVLAIGYWFGKKKIPTKINLLISLYVHVIIFRCILIITQKL